MKNRLQMLYDEYMEEKHSEHVGATEHQDYMKSLAVEMDCIVSLMNSNIDEVIKTSYSHKTKSKTAYESKWHMALKEENFKWLVYMRLEDEVKDAHMEFELCELAKKHGQAEIATTMRTMVMQRIKNAEHLNTIYMKLPYTLGTAEEHKEWDIEYEGLIMKHKENVAKLG